MPATKARGCSAQERGLQSAARASDSDEESTFTSEEKEATSPFTDTLSPERTRPRQGPGPCSPPTAGLAQSSRGVSPEPARTMHSRAQVEQEELETLKAERRTMEAEEEDLIDRIKNMTLGQMIDRMSYILVKKAQLELEEQALKRELGSRPDHPLLAQSSAQSSSARPGPTTPPRPPKHLEAEEPELESEGWWDDWEETTQQTTTKQRKKKGKKSKGKGKGKVMLAPRSGVACPWHR